MSNNVVGIILAGGAARRMGGIDKCLLPLGNETLLEHVITRVTPQVDQLLLNANGDPSRFTHVNIPIVEDCVKGNATENYAGPLAGILTGMEWAKEHAPEHQWLVSFPADTPFIPEDLVECLLAAVEEGDNQIACAKSNDRAHYVLGLWPIALYDELKQALTVEGLRKTRAWVGRFQCGYAEYSAESFDPFFNINCSDEMEEAEQMLKKMARE